MAKKKWKQNGRCAYCGETGIVEREHVVPSCLFRMTSEIRPLIVAACPKCNRTKGKDDVFLRDILVLDAFCEAHPTARAISRGAVFREVSRGEGFLFKHVLPYARPDTIRTRNGLIVGEVMSVKVDGDRIQRAIAWIVRGLFFHFFKEPLPLDTPMRIGRHYPQYGFDFWEDFKKLNPNGPHGPGDVFQCWFVFSEGKELTRWILNFYDGCIIDVWTGELVEEPSYPPEFRTLAGSASSVR